jgi:hypothetical protein
MAAIGAKVNKSGVESFASPNAAAPDPDAAIPAKKTTSPPGKTKPISRPVSIKMIPRTPIKPSVETTELASKRFTWSGYPTLRLCLSYQIVVVIHTFYMPSTLPLTRANTRIAPPRDAGFRWNPDR